MAPSERIDMGPPLAVLGALLLLVSLFLDWYEPGITAWTVFEALDLLLAALAFGCILGATARLGVALPGGRALRNRYAALSGVALVIVLSQVVNHPPAAVGEDPETGLWLGLGGAGLLALGGLLSVARISFAGDVEERRGEPAPEERPAAAPGPGATGETETRPLDVPSPRQEPQ